MHRQTNSPQAGDQGAAGEGPGGDFENKPTTKRPTRQFRKRKRAVWTPLEMLAFAQELGGRVGGLGPGAQTVSSLLETAERLRAAGISILPTSGPAKKPVFNLLPRGLDDAPTWAPYQEAIADVQTVRHWLGNGSGADLAIFGGAVSGQVLVIDFDHERFYRAWLILVDDLADGLYHEKTTHGYHVVFRCPEPGPNDQLAWIPNETEDTGRAIAIETRGAGGYCRVAPSPGCSVLAGDLAALPMLSQAHADALISAARSLDEAPYTRKQLEAAAKREASAKPSPTPREGESVIDVYNQANTIDATLTAHGYHVKGDGAVRPGGSSLSVKIVAGRSFHHSSNDALSDGYWHKPFDVYCQLERGDSKAAVKATAVLLGMDYASAKAPPALPKEYLFTAFRSDSCMAEQV